MASKKPTKAIQAVEPQQKEGEEKNVFNDTVEQRMLQIIGSSSRYTPTEKQIDKILSLQEKGMDYTHKERTSFLPKQKAELIILGGIVLTFLIIFTLTLFFAKDYIGEVVTGFIGLLTGGLGGYGYANSKIKKEE